MQPSVFSATGPLRLQACRVPVWSVKSTSRSKPVVADKAWSLPGHCWLVQLCTSSVTWNLHLELKQKRKQTEEWFIDRSRKQIVTLIMYPFHPLLWAHHRVLMTFEMEELRSSFEMKLYVMPKKASGVSWVFCFSWLTVYTSLMESTTQTKAAPHIHIYRLFLCRTDTDSVEHYFPP